MACLTVGVEGGSGHLGRQEADKSTLRSEFVQRNQSIHGQSQLTKSGCLADRGVRTEFED